MPRLSPALQANRRRQLLDGAIRALAARPGASMGRIATAIGVARSTLYRYFDTREDLVRALALDALDRADAACEGLELAPTCEAMLRGLFERIIPLGVDFHFLALEPSTYSDETVMRRNAARRTQIRQIVEWGQSTNALNPALPTDWLATYVNGLLWSSWVAVAEAEHPADEIAQLVTEAFWAGVRPPHQSAPPPGDLC